MSHYYSEKQDSALKLEKIRIKSKKIEFEAYSGSGVFSKARLDKGSQVLIDYCIIGRDWRVLDLGCGIGVVGIAIKKLYDCEVVFSDVNLRALKLTNMNLELHGLKAEVIKSNLFNNINDDYDCILSNPPYQAGRELCFKLIEDSFKHLRKKGLLQLVARHNKGGKTLSEHMEIIFGNVRTLAKKAGYRVYVSERN